MPAAPTSLYQATLRSALAGLWLIAGLFVTMILMGAVGDLLGHDMEIDDPFGIFANLIGFGGMGALWARSLARRADRRLAWGWALLAGVSYAIAVWLCVLALSRVEQNLGSLLQSGLPIHRLFMLSFSVAALLIAGTTCGVLGLILGGLRMAGRLALSGGLAAALAFLLVAVILDAFGHRVGAPGAEERLTMITSMVAGLLAAALAGSAVVGRTLAIRTARTGARVTMGAAVPEI